MARRGLQDNYGIGMQKLVSDEVPTWGGGKSRVGGFAEGYKWGKEAVDNWQAESAKREATEAGTAASEVQTRGLDTTNIDRGSYTPDAESGNYTMTPEARAATEASPDYAGAPDVVPTYKDQYGLGPKPKEWQDTKPTRDDVNRVKLEAVEKYWSESKAPGAAERYERASDRVHQHKLLAAQETINKLTFMGLQRNERKAADVETMNTEVGVLLDTQSAFAPGTPEHDKLQTQISARVGKTLGAVESAPYLAAQFTLGEARRKQALDKERVLIVKAAGSPEAAVEYYNTQYKDGSTSKIEDIGGGRKAIVQYNADGKRLGNMVEYRDWNSEGAPKILERSPQFAEEAMKLRIQHTHKLAELKLQTGARSADIRALIAGRDKDIELTPEEKVIAKGLEAERVAAGDDLKKLSAVDKKMDTFYRGLSIDRGKVPPRFTAPSRTVAESAMSAKDYQAWASSEEEKLSKLKGWPSGNTPEDQDARDALVAERMAKVHGVINVRGVIRNAGEPAAGENLEKAAEAERKRRAAAAAARGGLDTRLPAARMPLPAGRGAASLAEENRGKYEREKAAADAILAEAVRYNEDSRLAEQEIERLYPNLPR